MLPERLTNLMRERGKLEHYTADQVFHAQNFEDTLFMLQTGYVKRYQVTDTENRVIELIYGPGHIFPLSQLYKKVFGIEQNQENLIYVYQAMVTIDAYSMPASEVYDAIDKDHDMYIDLYYEAGLRLRSNIDRLASNAIKDDYKKVAHQLVCLAKEFGEEDANGSVKIQVPLRPIDMAEQLNLSPEVADAVLSSLSGRNLITVHDNIIAIPHMAALKDVYL